MKRSGDKHLPEDIFRDKLHDLEINPPERSWQGIQSRMAIKNKGLSKKRLLWAVPLVLIATMPAALWLHESSFDGSNIAASTASQDDTRNEQKTETYHFQKEITENFVPSILDAGKPEVIPVKINTKQPEPVNTRKKTQPMHQLFAEKTMLVDNEATLLNHPHSLPEQPSSNVNIPDSPEMNWQISVYGGGIANHRFIFANEESSQLKELRNEIETPALSFNAGISISKKLNKRLRLESGLEYTTFATNFNGNQYHYAYNTDQYSGSSVEMGLVKNSHAERSNYSDLPTDQDKAARVSYLAIPLKVNYHFDKFYVGAGLTAYQIIAGEAYFMHPKDLGQYSSYEIRKNMLAAGVNAGIEKNLYFRGNNITAYIEPEIRIGITSQFEHNFSLDYQYATNSDNSGKVSKQYPVMAGIKGGIRVNI